MISPKGRFVGLVDAQGCGGMSIGSADSWYLLFRLAAWRESADSVVRQRTRCEFPVSKAELTVLKGRINAYSIVEFEAAHSNCVAVTLRRILQTATTDPELESIAKELQAPIELVSPFGRLLYDRRFRTYVGSAVWCEKEIDIRLLCRGPDDTHALLEAGSKLFSAQSTWNRRVEAYAVEKLLPLKNKAWLSEGGAQLSAEGFTSRMKLKSISIEQTGYFTSWHGDGHLFGSHTIEIGGDIIKGLIRANILG